MAVTITLSMARQSRSQTESISSQIEPHFYGTIQNGSAAR